MSEAEKTTQTAPILPAENGNLAIYNAVRVVPEEAQKPIKGGRLNGMTDINPMWRIKTLTAQFGPCGIGWYVTLMDKHVEDGSGGQKVAVVDVALYVKTGGEWSKPIFGTGGSMLVANEKSGPFTSDEAFKMAYTDAISVCCKLLGVGADIYWKSDHDKYTAKSETTEPKSTPAIPHHICSGCGKEVIPIKFKDKTYTVAEIVKNSQATFGAELCWACMKKKREDEPA